ncbi:MAG: antitoxin Xre/MbcA/ParS toxin-binding domain-containing protein [Cytophagales bacterium]|nr:antitoxin Xre/MbcA/ParS toxin-binding domain-containing protein [Cytophagales bacterium]
MKKSSKSPKPYTTEDKILIAAEPVGAYMRTPPSESQLHTLSRKGVPRRKVEHVADNLGLSIYDIAPLLHVSSRTLLRYSENEPVDTPVSEHVLFLERLVAEGHSVFEHDEFITWLNSHVAALDHKKPMELLDTIFGIEMVRAVIGRVKYGVYS